MEIFIFIWGIKTSFCHSVLGSPLRSALGECFSRGTAGARPGHGRGTEALCAFPRGRVATSSRIVKKRQCFSWFSAGSPTQLRKVLVAQCFASFLTEGVQYSQAKLFQPGNRAPGCCFPLISKETLVFVKAWARKVHASGSFTRDKS